VTRNPLKVWMDLANAEQQQALADVACNGSRAYLYHWANGHREPSPTAARLVELHTRALHESTGGALPVVRAVRVRTGLRCKEGAMMPDFSKQETEAACLTDPVEMRKRIHDGLRSGYELSSSVSDYGRLFGSEYNGWQHLARNAYTMAELKGLSGEDRMTALAYYALLSIERLHRALLDEKRMSVPQPVVVTPSPVANTEQKAPDARVLCACFPGTCRGGSIVNGKTAQGHTCKACVPAESVKNSICGKTFDMVWAEKEAAGFRYGPDALEQVKLGWDLACSVQRG
jgi:hypothetical protein